MIINDKGKVQLKKREVKEKSLSEKPALFKLKKIKAVEDILNILYPNREAMFKEFLAKKELVKKEIVSKESATSVKVEVPVESK